MNADGTEIAEARLDARSRPEMTIDGTEIAPGVWVASAARADLGDPPALADDLADARTLPGWRRPEFLAGRHLLRRLLRQVRPGLATLPVRTDPAGKPRLDPGGTPDLALPGITISHDGDRIAVAVSGGHTSWASPPWNCRNEVGVVAFWTPSNLTGPLIVSNVPSAMAARIPSRSSPALATACCRISQLI